MVSVNNPAKPFFVFLFLFYKKINLGSVYSARGPNGRRVAIKVIDLNAMGSAREYLAASYLTEVKNLEVLRKESRHVVRIFDFDFDSRSGRCRLKILSINHQ